MLTWAQNQCLHFREVSREMKQAVGNNTGHGFQEQRQEVKHLVHKTSCLILSSDINRRA